ncbi:MAG: S-DNA-T family DNA segregation ATPase FtsK/SpoIIIE [Luteibaculaceae bacterium]|jgi:S-DNA-T family DNA segregation ATPase FtsK/SpoIIIE
MGTSQIGTQPKNKDNRRLRVGLSIAFVCFSVFSLLSLGSYLMNWKWDQSVIQSQSWTTIMDPEIPVRNFMGKFGAWWADLLMFRSFGIASFLFPLFFFIVGVRISSRKWLFQPAKFLQHLLFLCFMLPIGVALCTPSAWSPLEGKIGHFFFFFGKSYFGSIGSWILYLSGWAVYISFHLLFFRLLFTKVQHLIESSNFLKKSGKGNWMEFKDGEDAQTENKEPEKSEDVEVELSNEVKFDTPHQKSEKPEAEEKIDFTKITIVPPVEEEKLEEISVDETPPKEEESIVLKVEEGEDEKVNSERSTNSALRDFGPYDPTLDLAKYQNPKIDLLDSHERNERPSMEELEEKQRRIVDTLASYNIGIQEIKANIGPTVTLYEIIPKRGVRLSKIKNLEDDIALSLAALGIRIIAPIPGKGTVGIEVPNSNPDIVAIKSLLSSDKFIHSKMELPIAIGKTISNETFVVDLAKMPHLLMAGATGQGKSVGLNTILVSLLYKKHPAQLKLVLVDPKKVELSLFNKIERHYLAKLPDSEEPIITDTSKVVQTLNSLCLEMDARYDLLKLAFVRNIKEYNDKFIARKLNPENGHNFLPYIVLVVDEFADLIMTAGKEVEMPIARLAQLARAVGIHLIIATQRPSVNIITGTIKANFPARIAFRVTSKIDSRTILDAGGAEQLIGRGDMLYSTGNDLVRLQCAFVDTHEVEKITDFIGSQRGYPDCFLLPEYVDEKGEGNGLDLDEDRDALFGDAARLVVMTQQGSTSLIQRKLKLGYNRAGRIVDQLESVGILGPFEGSKARKVLIHDEISLEQFLSELP